jgi:hypothetical protein
MDDFIVRIALMKKLLSAKTVRNEYEETMPLLKMALLCATIAMITVTVIVTDAEDSYIMMMHITKTILILPIAENATR